MSANVAPSIVRTGLVLDLDAANSKSYVSGSLVWSDLTANGNTGTLTNGPTFSFANGGSIQFDGVDDYVLINSASVDFSVSSFSVCYFFKLNTSLGLYSHVWVGGGSFSNSPNLNAGLSIGTNSSGLFSAQITDGSILKRISFSWGLNTVDFFNVTYVVDRANNITRLYKNAQLVGSLDITGFGVCTLSKNIVLASEGGYGLNLNGNIPNFHIYNRALSPSEILQNYNALKGRFGL